MSREQYIKSLIKQRGTTIKDFAREVGIPYSTLLSLLNGSIGNASVDNVIRICHSLGVTVSDLQSHLRDSSDDLFLSDAERSLIAQYRLHPEMHSAVHKLLDIGS